MASRRKTTIFLFLGIILGLCFGFVLKNYRALELVKRCNFKPNIINKTPYEIINIQPDDTILNSQKNLLFVGVMTAKSFLHGRAKAVFDTWGRDVPGRIAFFSSEDSIAEGLPIVALKGVDDRYPPQKKSFMMLYYMYEHFIDKFEWFARADDDVYINTRKLEYFLRSIDSSKPQFIGQAGKGNTEEFGLLSLEFDENFCMGGPGVILSRETLRRVAPHIPTCLKNLYSTHEDVEIGRCVQKFAGIPCTWNYEMQSILHHNSSGRYAFTGNLKSKEIHSAITLHPIKKAPLMYRLHSYMQGIRAQELRQEALSLHRDIAQMKKLLQYDSLQKLLVAGVPFFPEKSNEMYNLGDPIILGISPSLNKYSPQNTSELQQWNFIARSIYSADHSNPKRRLESSWKEGLDDVITEIMENINNFSRQRGRVIEFRELLYGYSRVNALYGHDLIMDLLMIYKKYRGKKMTVPVRRHLYIQRVFTDVFVKELNKDNNYATIYNGPSSSAADNDTTDKLALFSSKVRNFWNTGLEKISDSFPLTGGGGGGGTGNSATGGGGIYNDINADENTKIVFVLSLSGRFTIFQRFLKNYEEICLKLQQNTDLLIVFFMENLNSLQPFYNELHKLREIYPNAIINQITLKGNFSRGIALDTATRSNHINDNDIIFFIDVDITYRTESLERIRKNTIQHKQVYLPIVFSQYDPKRIPMHHLHHPLSADEHNFTFKLDNNYNFYHNVNINYETGYFRQYGYGICAIYKSDILHPAINGFNTDINGWGLEDVKFLEKIIKLNQKPLLVLTNTAADENTAPVAVDDHHGVVADDYNKQKELSGRIYSSATTTTTTTGAHENPLRLFIFRSVDPSLVHVFHDIHCDENLEESQYVMCLGTKANTFGSYRQIESVLLNNKSIIEFISMINVNTK